MTGAQHPISPGNCFLLPAFHLHLSQLLRTPPAPRRLWLLCPSVSFSLSFLYVLKREDTAGLSGLGPQQAHVLGRWLASRWPLLALALIPRPTFAAGVVVSQGTKHGDPHARCGLWMPS